MVFNNCLSLALKACAQRRGWSAPVLFYMTTDDAKLLNTNDDKLCRKTPKVPNYLDNLEITRINAPFSSRNLVLSFFRCSNCFNSSSISESFFTRASFSFFSVSVRPPDGAGVWTTVSIFFLAALNSSRVLANSSRNLELSSWDCSHNFL